MSTWLHPFTAGRSTDEPVIRAALGVTILVLGGVAAILMLLTPTGGLASLWITLALHLIPGAVIGLMYRMRGFALALATVFGSEAALILVAMPMAWFGWWNVRPVATLLLVTLSSLGIVIATSDGRGTGRRLPVEISDRIRRWTFGPAGLATVGFAVALGASRPGDPTLWGAVVAAGPLAWLGLVGIVVAVVWAFGGGGGLGWAVMALTMVVPWMQSATYHLPTVQVAARHIGIAELIIKNGRLYPATDIYQTWSGLFAASAFVKVAAGWADLLPYASAWGAISIGMMVLAVRLVAGHFVSDERAWAAALFFGLGSSLNTPFFAPQMFGFVGAFVVITLLIRLGEPGRNDSHLRTGILLISTVVAVTHQLSPFLAFLAACILAVMRVIKKWAALLLLIVPAVLFAVLNRGVLGPFISDGDLGQFLQNLRPPDHSGSSALATSIINRLTFQVPAAALVVIGLVALVALWRFRTKQTLALALAAGSPAALFLGSSYGNEGIFRVALFALPWLAILAAHLLPEPGRRFWSLRFYPVQAIAVLSLTVVNVIGQTFMDDARVIRADDVAAITWVEQNAPEDSVAFFLGTDVPAPLYLTGRHMDYVSREMLFHGSSDAYPAASGAAYDPAADLALLTRQWASEPASHRYVLATETMAISSERYGQQLVSDQSRLEAVLRAKTVSWRVVFENEGARVYEFLGVA